MKRISGWDKVGGTRNMFSNQRNWLAEPGSSYISLLSLVWTDVLWTNQQSGKFYLMLRSNEKWAPPDMTDSLAKQTVTNLRPPQVNNVEYQLLGIWIRVFLKRKRISETIETSCQVSSTLPSQLFFRKSRLSCHVMLQCSTARGSQSQPISTHLLQSAACGYHGHQHHLQRPPESERVQLFWITMCHSFTILILVFAGLASHI